jgi:periplasmic protein TonB
MFDELRPASRRPWNAALLLSFAAHGLILLLASRHSPATLVPHEVALGTPYSSGSVVYLAPLGPERTHDSEPLQIAKVTKPKPELASPPRPVARKREEPGKTAADAADTTASAGSPYGVHIPGTPFTGPAVIPALPEVFPDPPVARSDLPPGVEGDVIVEVTIDPQGNVTDLKLTQGIGYGIDQKVLAVLRRWHFRPATRDGLNIASQHLVHFHYPA